MHIFGTDPELERLSARGMADPTNCTGHPVVAFLYEFSGALMELLGPLFWAVLIVLFIQAELF